MELFAPVWVFQKELLKRAGNPRRCAPLGSKQVVFAKVGKRYEVDGELCRNLEWSSKHEWLLADGTGGFAMGTVAGLNTRRYHGHLVAAIEPPANRMVLVDSIEAFAEVGGRSYGLSVNQYPGALHPDGHTWLEAFAASPEEVRWTFSFGGAKLRKTLALAPGTATITYENVSKRTVGLMLRPLVCHKPYHANFQANPDYPDTFSLRDDELTLEHQGVELNIAFEGANCQPVQGWYYRFEHGREAERGLNPRDDLYCPCEWKVDLRAGDTIRLVMSANGAAPVIERASFATPLQQACEPFLVRTSGRTSIIAGYPWFTDWGRDTMISLPGVCLGNGHVEEAMRLLMDYASQMRNGLIPNRFVESGEAEFNTADASLWFVNAVYRVLDHAWDAAFARQIAPAIQEVVSWHQRGTDFGIRVDTTDGLLTQGGLDTQLTWMDAKIGDWVVTPRYGKAVELNGLWINALRIVAWVQGKLKRPAQELNEAAERAEAAYHARFWSEIHGWYFDTVDPNDAQLRPNQVISLSLPFGPLDSVKAEAVLQAVEAHLLTPKGLRTLAPFEIHYQGRFSGPLPELDAAYHQGTVWPWLLGIYWQACKRVRGTAPIDEAGIQELLGEYGLGGIAECYDGDAPHAPGGCPWQAWSVATLADAWHHR